MTAITFPTDPANDELYTAPNGCVYIWDGEKWVVNSTIYTGAALENISQDRVAPMFVNGVNTGITFAYNATTNTLTSTVTGGSGSSLVNGNSSFSISTDGTLTLTHPAEPNYHPLSTTLTIQKAAGNYHTISGAYGLSLQATPVPSGYGLNTNTNFVDIFHDGISVNVNDNTWGFGTDGKLTLPNGQSIGSGSLDGIKMTTDRGTVLFGNSPECVPTLLTHFHIMKDDPANVDLFLGDDNNYVKLPGSGETAYGVEIGTNVGSAYTWRFGTDGNLTLPVGGDILDSNGDSVLGGGADTAVSYKGFKAVYARMYDDEPTISKVLIYQDTVTTTPTLEIDPDTDDDLFKVSGLANSSVIALVNIYGADNTHPTALSTLQHFAKSIIDNVILDNGDAGTNIDAYNMRTKFYDNFNTFASRAGERYKNFEFLREEWSNISGTGGSGTGATFYLERDLNDDVIDYANTNQKGINYQVGDVITISGATLGGTTPENNIVITVTEVGVGGRIDAFTYTGILPANLWPLDSISDGGADQYDSANYIFTNIQGDSYAAGGPGVSEEAWAVNYNGGDVNESGAAWFGAGSEYVTTYNDSIFGLFVTGANINWIATNGNSGFDGDGQADTGSLQLADTDGLTNGDQSFVLNADGSVTFPDGTTQTTAYTEGDPNVWVQDFESTTIGVPTDTVATANSVEYLSNGDIVAVFQHYYEEGQGTYNTIGRFTPTGEKVWSMKFQGDVYTDGWGLAVNNDGGYIFLAGQRGGITGYNSAVLTKLEQSNGAIVWTKTYDVGYTNSNVVVDMSGNDPIVVGYAYNGTDARIVTSKIDGGTGDVIWSKALDGQGDDQAYGMAVDNNNGGDIVTVGYIDTFGVQNAAATLYTEPASNPNWTQPISVYAGGVNLTVTFTGGVPTFTNVSDTLGNRTVDDELGIISGGGIGGATPADNMTIKVATVAANDTNNRMVVVKYNSNGAIQWQRAVQVEPGYNCTGADAAIDGDGNIYVCGNFDGPNQSMILIKFNQSGTKKWTRKVQGPCEDYASSVVVGPDNCLYLSAYTASADEDFSMVIAKYNLDGTVAWQRLLDSLTNWTFAGQFFFGPNGAGGSTIAVRDGYVAVVGGVANFNVYSEPRAIIAQFGTDGKIFTRGDYDFKAATFSGLLNTTASNITVSDAGKVSSDYDEEFTVGDFEPYFDLTSDLVGTVYRSVNAGNELVNGNYTASLNANGSVTLPAGGTVSEGYVTSNPTIQLTPARPDVASQKLVIKGGGIPYILENGIEVSVSHTTRTVGETLTVTVYSDTYANQTLYWWINPEGVGISDPESGTVTLTNNQGNFSFVVDSDDYEFRVRVSPEDYNYGPGVIGAQSALINSGEPTFNYEHHLHLTTGNLAETSILLGTDNHNVRTTTDGGIEITTETTTVNPPDTITITGADVAGVNLVYTRDPVVVTPTWKSPVVNALTDPYIAFNDGEWGIFAPDIDPVLSIYVNAGTLAKPFTQWSLNPPYGSTAPTGVYTYIAPDVHAWQFGIDGNLTIPATGDIVRDGTSIFASSTALPIVTITNANYNNFDQPVAPATQTTEGAVSFTVTSPVALTATGLLLVSGSNDKGGTIVAGSTATGTQTLVFEMGGYNSTYTVMAFATTANGTSYSAPVAGLGGYVCFPAGTMITLSNGTKKAIEDIGYDDNILVWNFDLGEYAAAKPIWIKASETATEYNVLTFSDGSVLKTVGNHHIFNKQAERFTHTMTADTPIGTVTVNEQGEEITLVSAEVVKESVEFYNVWTEYHLNMFAQGVLTSNRFNNTYPIVGMKFVKGNTELRDLAEFNGIDPKWIQGLRLQEQAPEHTAEYIKWYVSERLEKLSISSVETVA